MDTCNKLWNFFIWLLACSTLASNILEEVMASLEATKETLWLSHLAINCLLMALSPSFSLCCHQYSLALIRQLSHLGVHCCLHSFQMFGCHICNNICLLQDIPPDFINEIFSIWQSPPYTRGSRDGGKEPTCQFRRCKRRRFSPWVGKIPWRRTWQPTPVFLPGESHGQRSLAGCSP